MPWYQFTPIGAAPYDPSNPNNYTLVGSTPPSCPSPNNFLCAIQANDNSGKPIITCIILAAIAFALVNRIETTIIILRPTII